MDEAFFRAAFDADHANQAKQDWATYWVWVRTFYEGKRFPPVPGWNKREVDAVKGMPADRADAVREAFAVAGRVVAAEWAKDNSVRKVSTDDLKRWGDTFGAAAGDADGLLVALSAVQADVAKR